jgi:N-acetylneuraminate synthase
MNNLAEFSIADLVVGDEHPPLVVVELGINHGGDLQTAIKMANEAIDAGAQIIKHQTHIPDAEMSMEARFVKPGNSHKSIYEVISENTLSEESEFELMRYVNSRGVVFISTPFSREAFFRLREWGVPAYKIGSGECNNYPLVDLIASDGKPIILSTGMNSLDSISTSVSILRQRGVPFALLHTTNLYPTPQRLIRLAGIDDLKQNFPDAVVGLSDHSRSNAACIAAVAHGARILERHFTDSKDRNGPDISCSMDAFDLRQLIRDSQDAFIAEGGGRFPADEEQVTIQFAFASVVSTKEILPGEILSQDNVWVKRPFGGDFGPSDFEKLLGRIAAKKIHANCQISKDDIV